MRRILFVLGSDYLPASVSGSNVSIHALCRRLVAAGFEPMVACAPDRAAARRPAVGAWSAPTYPVLRLADPVEAMKEIIARLEPEAVVLRGPVRAAEWAMASGHPLHVYFASDFHAHGFPSPREAPNLRYAANSPFLVRLGEAYFGAPVALVPSVIEPAEYRCERAGEAVLFVNPAAVKGVHIAAAVAARLPHRHFLFVRSWTDDARNRHTDIRLPNVEWAETTLDMRPLFACTKLILMPSVWEESSGRTLGEAQLSGIPAVVSDRGGLRESVGAGGVVIPLGDPIERWCEAVEAMFTDEVRYATLSRLARQHADRPDYTPERAVARFLEFIAS